MTWWSNFIKNWLLNWKVDNHNISNRNLLIIKSYNKNFSKIWYKQNKYVKIGYLVILRKSWKLWSSFILLCVYLLPFKIFYFSNFWLFLAKRPPYLHLQARSNAEISPTFSLQLLKFSSNWLSKPLLQNLVHQCYLKEFG